MARSRPDYILTIPHTGTREIALKFGISLHEEGPSREPNKRRMEAERVLHTNHLSEETLQMLGLVVVPVRNPVAVVESHVARGKNVSTLGMYIDRLEIACRHNTVIPVPVDVPEIADRVLWYLFGIEQSPWPRAGATDYDRPAVMPSDIQWMRALAEVPIWSMVYSQLRAGIPSKDISNDIIMRA